MHIGIFDSGIGGEAIAMSLRALFPKASITTVNDRLNVPYGDKPASDIIRLTEAAIRPLLDNNCDVIVIACNTATTVALPHLRRTYPSQLFIGIEPMIKPAAELTKTNVIAVCATPATLSSGRYHALVRDYAAHLTIIEPDCSMWAQYIEENTITKSHIDSVVDECTQSGADVIVLGCTHYHWIKKEIADRAGEDIIVLEPSEAIGQRILKLLNEHHQVTGLQQ